MENIEIIDSEETQEDVKKSKGGTEEGRKAVKRYTTIALICCVITLIAGLIHAKVVDLDESFNERIFGLLMGAFVGIPVLAILMALFPSIFPFRDRSSAQKILVWAGCFASIFFIIRTFVMIGELVE